MSTRKIQLFDRTTKADRDFWRGQLADLGGPSGLPATGVRRPGHRSGGELDGEVEHAFDDSLVARLEKITGGSPMLLFTVALVGVQAVLQRYSGEERVAVGSPPRLAEEAEVAANALPVISEIDPAAGLKQHLKARRGQLTEVYNHQSYSHDRMLRDAGVTSGDGGGEARFPLFDVAVAVDGFHAVLAPVGHDASLHLEPGEGSLTARLAYRSDLLSSATGERFLHHLETFLAAALEDLDRPLGELSLMDDAERAQVLGELGTNPAEAPPAVPVHRLFEERAAVAPDAPAVVAGDVTLSYRQLDRRAAHLARRLAERGVGPEVLVGLCVERSPEMVVSLLAVLKAGGAYLPLDPTYPAQRLAHMVEDAGVGLVITRSKLADALPASAGGERLLLDEFEDELAAADAAADDADAAWRAPEVDPAHLAYVIYTSGSTGRPKGVALSHRGLVNLSRAQGRAFDLDASHRVVQFASLSFDASIWETVMALTHGAALCLASSDDVATGDSLVGLLHRAGVTTATLPPSMLAVLDPADLPDLTTVVAAGEACSADLAGRWSGGRRFFNAYGPSETTVCASYHECREVAGPPPIGTPVANTELRVVDAELRPVAVGVPGELLVGGVPLARGYLGRPALTAERFVPDPFSDRGGRLYRTGDRVRWRADGELAFHGRFDHQVKLRGFRIELGEVESVLADHPGVRQAVAVLREDTPGATRLVAYWVAADGAAGVAAGGAAPDDAELREHLAARLPEHMIPAAFVGLDELPLSPAGKVDRDALPAPDRDRPELEVEYVAPRDDVEATLARMWAELLDVERVGVDDSFFDLGGNSLQATQIISRVREGFGAEVDLPRLLRSPTVASLARLVVGGEGVSGAPPKGEIGRRGKSIDEQLADLDLLTEEDPAPVGG